MVLLVLIYFYFFQIIKIIMFLELVIIIIIKEKNKRIFNYTITKKNLLKLKILPDIVIHCAGYDQYLKLIKIKKKISIRILTQQNNY